MHLTNGQSIILDWFKHNADTKQNLSKIRVICQNISKIEGLDEDKNYLYRYFFPLVRIGLVEFQGSDNYSLSSPVLYNFDKTLIAINFNLLKTEKLNHFIINEYFNGLILYFDHDNIDEIELALETKANVEKTNKLLYSLPTLYKIVNDFENKILVDTNGFQKYTQNGWRLNFEPNSFGCYKAADNIASQRYILFSKDNWKLIPSRNINPDAFNISAFYSKIIGNEYLGIKYSSSKKELTVSDIHFPIIMERVLWLLYLNRLDEVSLDPLNSNTKTFINFSLKHFNLINKFLLNKISINE